MMQGQDFEAPGGALTIRETFDFTDDWRHMDRWRDVGTYTVLSDKRVASECDADGEVREVTLLVDAPGASPGDVSRAIVDAHTSRSCSHEHDCCGCLMTGAQDPVRISGERWSVVVSSARNH